MKVKFLVIFIVVLAVLGSFFIFFYNEFQPVEQSKVNLLPLAVVRDKITRAEPEVVVELKNLDLTVQFFGDIMLDRVVAKVMGDKGLDYIFAKVNTPTSTFFLDANLMIANLEGPFASKRISTTKSIAFKFDPSFAKQLKIYGFDSFNLANNHSYDMGPSNVLFTRKTLKDADLGYFGDELNEGPQYTYISSSVAFIGLHNTYHKLNLDKVKQAIDDAHAKAKYIVVNVHWGEEYVQTSSKKQRDLAYWLVDNGVDAVIGHHPHVVEEMEVYKNKPIFYSLGNFIFDQYFSKETQEGLSVGLTFGESGLNKIYILPFYSEKSQVQTMNGRRYDEFIKWFSAVSRLGDKKIVDGYIKL